MEATLREMQQAEPHSARPEAQAAAMGAASDGYAKRLAALREKLDDLVLQIGVVQAELEAGDVETAQVELNELWIILHAVDRRFRDLPA